MSIRKGEQWGSAGPLDPNGVVVYRDDEAREAVEEARRERRSYPELGLLGGDLCHTLGGTGDHARLTSESAMRFPLDLGVALLDGRTVLFVAHLIARGRAWAGEFLVAMNAQWCGSWNLGPRSHPGDGLLDLTQGSLSLGDRLKARRRAPTGSHLPHPDLHQQRRPAAQAEFGRPRRIYADGTYVGEATKLSIRVDADALVGVV